MRKSIILNVKKFSYRSRCWFAICCAPMLKAAFEDNDTPVKRLRQASLFAKSFRAFAFCHKVKHGST